MRCHNASDHLAHQGPRYTILLTSQCLPARQAKAACTKQLWPLGLLLWLDDNGHAHDDITMKLDLYVALA